MRIKVRTLQHNRPDADSCFSRTLKANRNCTDIFEESNNKFRDGGSLGTDGNWKHRNFLPLILTSVLIF